MNCYKVINWKKKDLVYNYRGDVGLSSSFRIRKTNEEVDGFFLMVQNTPLICFTDSSKKNKLVFDSNRIIKGDEVTLSIKTNWPFVNTKITCKSFTIKFREFVPLLLLQNKLDPTFDWLDLSCDLFSAYIAEELGILDHLESI